MRRILIFLFQLILIISADAQESKSTNITCTYKVALPKPTDRVTLRNEPLTPELIEALSTGDTQSHNRSYAGTLLNGSCVQLIEEYPYCYQIKFEDDGEIFEGYVTKKYAGALTIKPTGLSPSILSDITRLPPLLYVGVVALILVLGIWGFFSRRRLKRKKKLRNSYYKFILGIYPRIQKLYEELKALMDFQHGYLAYKETIGFIKKARTTIKVLELMPYKEIALTTEQVFLLDTFQTETSQLIVKLRNKRNQEYIQEELKTQASLFESIGSHGLDDDQKKAVIIDEDYNLVVAGAGSGKTTTIVGKVAYLIHRHNVSPSNILLISFTNKACDEMKERLKRNLELDMEILTFHKFGLKIIKEATLAKPDIFRESDFHTKIEQIFVNKLRNDPVFSENSAEFLIHHLKPIQPPEDFASRGEYIEAIKDQNFQSFKKIKVEFGNRTVTMRREPMKSMEEVAIANFLFLHNIQYDYERPYQSRTTTTTYRQYKPDFYLPKYDIYIEHFGINRAGNVPSWFADDGDTSYEEENRKYSEGMDWKRNLHDNNDTVLIETYSYQAQEDTIFTNLKSNLQKHGVAFERMSGEEIWNFMKDELQDEATGLIELIKTFLNLYKSSGMKKTRIRENAQAITKKNLQNRANIFLDLFLAILEEYQVYLKKFELLDFSDMIQNSTQEIKSGKYTCPYLYILIDEFQDMGMDRYELIRALLASNPQTKLFAVGDDWQSIYRFAGSDISLFTQFDKHFSSNTDHSDKYEGVKISQITNTYRFGPPLLTVSSKFILTNPNQSSKKLKTGIPDRETAIEIRYHGQGYDRDDNAVANILEELFEEDPYLSEREILILGRYNHDLERITKGELFFSDNNKLTTYTNPDLGYSIQMKFHTVHRAKGLEADYTIILNCNNGRYGFPATLSDDPILNLVLCHSDQFPNGEERRAFYVAITRARRSCYLVSYQPKTSKFVTEVKSLFSNEEYSGSLLDDKSEENHNCPKCKTGLIIVKSGTDRNGNHYSFEGCTNYNWGCDHQKWL